MSNSLISTHLWSIVMRPMMEKWVAEQKETDSAIAEFMEETGCSRDDVRLELRNPFGPRKYTCRLITPEERWIDWFSDNHGWERDEVQE